MDPSQIELALARIRTALEAGEVQAAIDTLTDLHPVDRADAFSDLDDRDQAALLPRLDLEATADLLEQLEDEQAAAVAETFDTEQLADVLDEMEPDEAADVLGDLPADRAEEALAEMEEAMNVRPLLPFGDETAGGRMTTSFIALPMGTTASEAIQTLRKVEPSAETPYYLYVEDEADRLVGIVGLRDLVISDPNAKLETIMDPEVMHARAQEDQEEVALRMARYDLAALPVVNDRGVVVGVITHDDVLDVVAEEATEDIYRLANVSDSDLSIHSSIRFSLRKRIPWLYLNAVTALFAAWVVSNFELLIAEVAILAIFLSVVAGMGGNTATQSLALIVRAIALGEIELRSAWRTVLKESLTGLLAGVLVGTVLGLAVWLWQGNAVLGVILGLALIGNMLIAGFAGALVPITLRTLGLDPALASSVLVTTVTDSVGFALFLSLSAMALSNLQ
ncbi:MAG: magnesium transporter [Anaerolineae bacterium]|nr:MAG: magnesium transporter [Anaerolineae bacterium]